MGVDKTLVRKHIFLTAIANCSQMLQAIPNCKKMAADKEWDTIKDRHDPRIADNIDGKSTLRSTLTQVNNGLNFLEIMGADKVLETWIQDFWVKEIDCPAKTEEMINGIEG